MTETLDRVQHRSAKTLQASTKRLQVKHPRRRLWSIASVNSCTLCGTTLWTKTSSMDVQRASPYNAPMATSGYFISAYSHTQPTILKSESIISVVRLAKILMGTKSSTGDHQESGVITLSSVSDQKEGNIGRGNPIRCNTARETSQ